MFFLGWLDVTGFAARNEVEVELSWTGLGVPGSLNVNRTFSNGSDGKIELTDVLGFGVSTFLGESSSKLMTSTGGVLFGGSSAIATFFAAVPIKNENSVSSILSCSESISFGINKSLGIWNSFLDSFLYPFSKILCTGWNLIKIN